MANDSDAAVGAGLLGGIVGQMAGAAIAGGDVPRPVYVEPPPDYAWRRHVRSCCRAYGEDYDPYSDTWIDYYGYERPCRL